MVKTPQVNRKTRDKINTLSFKRFEEGEPIVFLIRIVVHP